MCFQLKFWLGIILLLLVACEQPTKELKELYISAKKAKKEGLLLAEYSLKNNYEDALSAYAYSVKTNSPFWQSSEETLSPQILLIRTNQNIEKKGKFLALNKLGQTGKVVSTDSTYLIYTENQSIEKYDYIILYEFAVEKPDEKYQLNMRDSLFLEKIK